MNKEELVQEISKKANVTQKEAAEVLSSLVDTIQKTVAKGKKALNFKEMVGVLPKNHAARKQLRILTVAQLAGYLYSGLVLGVGIPKLNGYLTNKREAKKAAMAAELAKTTQPQVQDAMLKPENIQFLNQKNFTGMNLLAS